VPFALKPLFEINIVTRFANKYYQFESVGTKVRAQRFKKFDVNVISSPSIIFWSRVVAVGQAY
jgi:hypothetical protein